jgi:predicted RNA-binding protein YlqC (UPF0109 family)
VEPLAMDGISRDDRTQRISGIDPMTNAEEKAIELVTVIVNALSEYPERVKISSAPGLIIIEAPPGEIGKVIGKHGHTARSIRSILSSLSMREKQPLQLDIVERGERHQ